MGLVVEPARWTFTKGCTVMRDNSLPFAFMGRRPVVDVLLMPVNITYHHSHLSVLLEGGEGFEPSNTTFTELGLRPLVNPPEIKYWPYALRTGPTIDLFL